MKYKSDFWFLGTALFFLVLSAYNNPQFSRLFAIATWMGIIWVAIFLYLLFKKANKDNLESGFIVFITVGPILALIYTSLVHPDIFGFLSWVFIGLEIGNVLIKTW